MKTKAAERRPPSTLRGPPPGWRRTHTGSVL
jgi:hypothetical protein